MQSRKLPTKSWFYSARKSVCSPLRSLDHDLMIVAKLKGGRERMKSKEGKCEGRKAFGEVDEAEQVIVERMKELRLRV